MKYTLALLVIAMLFCSALADHKDDKNHPKHTKNDGHGHKRSVRSAGYVGYGVGYGPAVYAGFAPYGGAYGYGYGLGHGQRYGAVGYYG